MIRKTVLTGKDLSDKVVRDDQSKEILKKKVWRNLNDFPTQFSPHFFQTKPHKRGHLEIGTMRELFPARILNQTTFNGFI
ncbi:hypothetical protein DXU93_07390 [Brumimicrobium aurantiacum]|uniref:Uncharacterized protein n=1 Tax=Brumimicrobium aurantiacum TaxID=1737063 RepID=A0A3E1EZ07_9FLAO|nr:hypothetical protein DXU93_07390 [Brumimicrobium aurantiacum]